MPFFKTQGQLIYFAHVPKCAGTGVEDYIKARFGALAFLDRQYFQKGDVQPWTRTSPQHIEAGDLGLLIPPGFFDQMFTVVRHPMDRLISMYHFNIEVGGHLEASVAFGDWLAQIEDRWAAEDMFYLDNHPRPMSDFVPLGTKVFYLESGLAPVQAYLDQFPRAFSGPEMAEIPMRNHRSARLEKGTGLGDKITPTRQDIRRISRMYEEDFERFGYDPEITGASPARLDGEEGLL